MPDNLKVRVYSERINRSFEIKLPLVEHKTNLYLTFTNEQRDTVDVAALPIPNHINIK